MPANRRSVKTLAVSSLEDDDVEPAGAVGAEFELLRDVGGAGRSGDHVDGAWHGALSIGAAEPVPHLFVGADQILRLQHHDVGVGQQVERGRVVGSRHQDQGSGLRDAREGMRQRDLVGGIGPPVRDLEPRRPMPGQRHERPVEPMPQPLRQVAVPEIGRDPFGNVAGRGHPLDRCVHRRRHLAEERDPMRQSAPRTLGRQVAAMLADALGDVCEARRFIAADAEPPAHASENAAAGGLRLSHASCPSTAP
jgi:hypothetical protein